MSTILMSACWPLEGMSPAQKAVLISLADQSNDDGYCWPSVASIARRTCLSERAVQGAIRWLHAAGLLRSSERRGTSTVYQVTPAAYAPPQEMRPADAAPHPRSKCTPPPQMLRGTPADAAPKPSLNHQGTIIEPSGAPQPGAAKVRSHSVADLVDLGVDEDVATEFLAIRKRKRASLTPLALTGIRREAEKAGWTLNDVLRKAVERGWQSVEASWLLRDAAPQRQDGPFDPLAYVNRNRTSRRQGGGHVIDV